MGDDPVAWRTWRRGLAADMSGAELAAGGAERAHLAEPCAPSTPMRTTMPPCRMRSSLMWKRARASENLPPRRGAIDFLARGAGVLSPRRASGDACGSCAAKRPSGSIRRARPMWRSAQLERIVLKETAEQFAYDPAWDAGRAGRGADAGPHGHLAPERAPPDRQRAGDERVTIHRVHDPRRLDAGQCDLRQRPA